MLAPLLLAVLMATSVLTTDKYLAIEISPRETYPGCTPHMTLRCTINITSSTTPGMELLGETPVTVDNVNALILKKEGVLIASVTYSDSMQSHLLFDSDTPAQIYGDTSNMAVEGSLVGVEEECGFLEVTWTDPMFSLNGTYECVANGMSVWGGQVTTSVPAGVIIEGADMGLQISELESSLAECTASSTLISELESSLAASSTLISELESSLAECTASSTLVENTTLAPTTSAPTTSAPTTSAPTTPCTPTATSLARQPATVDGISVLCDTETDGGNWIIIQRRTVGDVDFYRNWNDYQQGFGTINGDHWLGLSNMYNLCNATQRCVVRFDMAYGGNPHNDDVATQPGGLYFQEYSDFYLGNAEDKFRLHVSGPSGTAGDSLVEPNTGTRDNLNLMQFSTHDQDNDVWSHDCAATRHAAWWYRKCSLVSLNGVWGATTTGLWWQTLTGANSVTSSEIKVRRQ